MICKIFVKKLKMTKYVIEKMLILTIKRLQFKIKNIYICSKYGSYDVFKLKLVK